jgi:hypothetical protein
MKTETRGQLFTPHTLGLIVRKLQARRALVIRRGGVRCSFAVSEQPTLQNLRIEWTAKIDGYRHQGKSGTVWDATAEIERLRFPK